MAPLSQLSGHLNYTCGAENSTGASQARPHAYYALSYCALILAIVFGNGLVCMAVLKERALQTTTNYLVVSLAVADLLVATLVMPWVVYLEVTGGVWNFSRVCCDVFVTLDVMMCTASILNLCAISIDRYTAVVMPVHYQHGTGQSSCRRVALMITAVWVLAFAVSCPLLFGFNTTGDPTVCSISNPDFVIYSSVVSFYLPFGVTVLVYARIYVVLKQRRRRRILTRQNSQCNSVRPGFPQQTLSPDRAHLELKRYYSICQDTALGGPGFQERGGELKREEKTWNSLMPLREKKATQMVAIVLGAFIVCWLPFFLTHVLNTHCQTCHVSPELYSATTWLGYVNSALNPVIYTTFNIEFRKAFLKILSC
ncbi:D(3) dopamine receptor isoform X2 [Nomascus leucogenys]|uniref:D(3) dopamine receptor n=1 Tax=Nomascus leucogenys TaxID=61853 RepID=G1QXU0_NOMLE|nr:D(3) dopamine receptor isoform X2 [Nomascus leucogenys]XP_032005015.1 D(3) dopamine receptor isoform X2 [Hylobates moloch]XP_055115629.1 D(3) dopamine receptor isoform X2 [Symphalangus syndactylus]